MADLAVLTQRLAGFTKRRAGIAVALCGAAGIGKSFAAARLLAGLHCKSVSVRAVTTPAQLSQTLGRPKQLPTWVERELERTGTPPLEALLTLLKHLAPLALCVEDLHECDAAQLEFWSGLGRGVQQLTGVAMIVSSRTVPPAVFETVPLEPLSVEATRELLEREIGAKLPREATMWIQTRAAGNPLFSLEFLRFLARRGSLWSDGTQWHWRDLQRDLIPATVEAMIERAIDEACATSAERTALTARAYCEMHDPNQPLEAELWADVAGLELLALVDCERALRSRGVLNEAGFVHPLFREVPVGGLSATTKRELATRAVVWLEGDHPARATSFLADADYPHPRAFALLERARVALDACGEHGLARDCLVRSVQYAPADRRTDLALQAARQLLDAGDARVAAMLEPVIANSSDPSAALLLLAAGQALQGEREAVKATLSRVVHSSSDLEWLTVRIRLYFTVGLHEELLALWRAFPALHGLTSNATLYYAAWSLLDHGDFVGALALIQPRLAVTPIMTLETADLLDIRASVAFYEGRYSEALTLFEQVAELYRNGGAWDGLSNALRNGCVTRLQLGQYRDSLSGFEESLRLYSQHGKWTLYAQTLQMSAVALLELGEYERTEAQLLEALEILGQQAQPFLVHVLSSLTALYLDWPAPHASTLARKYALWCQRAAEQLANPMSHCIAGLGLTRLILSEGQGALALEQARKLLEQTRALGALELELNAQLLLGLAFESTQQPLLACEQLQVALHNALGHEMPLEGYKINLEIARIEGNVLLGAQCLAWFEEHGLRNGANLARRYFPQVRPVLEVAQLEVAQLEVALALRLEVLGDIRMQVSGSSLALRGRQRQELLVQLLEARLQGRTEVSSLALCDALYPDIHESEAAGALKQVVFKLRLSHGAGAIITTPNGYALGAITSDAEAFLNGGDTRLWRGAPALISDNTVELLALALHTRAVALLDTDALEVVRVARILFEISPYDRNALTLLCTALRDSSNHRSLTRSYAAARDQWLEVGETLPLRWQDFLAAQTP